MRFCFLLASVLATSVYALPEIEFPPKDQEVVLGQSASLGVIPRQQKQFAFQWSKDGIPIPGATNDQIVLRRPKFTDAGLYSVTLFDDEGAVSADARLSVRAPRSGDADFSFDPDILTQTDAPVILRQPDGKLIVTGSFSHMNGQLRRGIARLNADGATDITFSAALSGVNYQVNDVAVQKDGKVVIAGYLDSIEGESWDGGIARLNRDGSLDRAFKTHPAVRWSGPVTIQEDGKILLGTAYRLNSDGTLDLSFDHPWTPPVNASQSAFALQSDGKILVGLSEARTALVRLEPNGALDTNFVTRPVRQVTTLDIDTSGKILVAGTPTLLRLNADGTTDATFGGEFPLVPYLSSAMKLKSGKIAFTGIADDTLPPGSLVILEGDGTITSEFAMPGAYRSRALAADEDDNVLVLTSISNQFVHSWIDLKGESRRIVPFQASYPGLASSPVGVQSDGRLIVKTAHGIQRQNLDGSVDSGFVPEPGPAVTSASGATVQPDDKILLGLSVPISSVASTNAAILRLDKSGSIDTNFTAPRIIMNDWRSGFISSLAVQPDQRIVVGGLFSTVNGEARTCLVRLLPNGSVDPSFERSAGVSGMLGGDPEYPPRPYIGSISLQEDGKIVLTGLFTLVNGVPRTGFARLEANGALDESFQPSPNLSNIVAIAIQPDGKLIVAAPNLVRLNADGTYDSSFRQGPDREPITGVRALALTAENKILIGGTFTNIDGFPRAYLARLNESGEMDLTFLSNLTGPDDSVSSISTGRSGDVYVAGAFMRFNGADRPSIARVFLEGAFSFGPEILLSNGQLHLNWSALQPGTYQLEYKTNLSQSTWITFSTTLLSGGEPPEISIQLRQFDDTQCFFRMKFVP